MKKLNTIIGIATLFFTVSSVAASEVTGTLSTGLGNNSVSGIVIAAPAASPVAGTYTGAQTVTLTASGATSVRYTVDGNTPTCSTGSLYVSPVSVVSSTVIKAISCYPNAVISPVATYSYTINPIVSSGGGGGGGGGSSFIPVVTSTVTTPVTTQVTPTTTTPKVTATPPKGQVLGASTVNFSVDLKLGVRGKDVLELQKLLVSQGFLKIATPTNYFGPATRSALIAFQKKNKIVPASGIFGPLTRAYINKQKSTL